MKAKVIWLLLSCLMIAALLLVSCAPATPPEEEKPAPPTEEKPAPPTEEKPAPPKEEKPAPTVEGPKYGGIFVDSMTVDPSYFDEGAAPHIYWCWTLQLTNEELVMGDWAKGPTGSGEASFLYIMPTEAKVLTGELAESWDIPDEDTLVFHIRQGIHWHNKPPTNGRELTADDVAFSLNRLWTTPTAYHCGAYPWKEHFEELNGGPWIEATDKWTVVFKCKPGKAGSVFVMAADHAKIFPRDAVEYYGSMKDWRNAIGTGPFMLVDYVAGSSMTFERNPDYWMKDPLHPENQFPYLDGVKRLVIPDMSTRLAAMRTAKIDLLGAYYTAVGWEDATSLLQTTPELKYLKYVPSGTTILYWRIDREHFSDKSVRRALSMAIDRHEIADTLYGGTDAILTWPALDVPEFSDVYIPIEELPESTREVYEYHPDTAKQLLAEAGYPNGFKTSVVCYQAQVDLLSVVKDYWSRIGVDLELDVKEYAVMASIRAKRSYEQCYMWGAQNTIPFRFVESRPGSVLNLSMINDEKMNTAYAEIQAAWRYREKQGKLMKEITPYILDQCYELQFPVAAVYSFWWPWVKGYSGEIVMGYANYDDYHGYLWLDQDLKEEMTGRR